MVSNLCIEVSLTNFAHFCHFDLLYLKLYSSLGTARLKEFAEELRSVIMSIIPSKTPINLVFDGVVDETDESVPALSGYRLGQVPLEVSDEHVTCFLLLIFLMKFLVLNCSLFLLSFSL